MELFTLDPGLAIWTWITFGILLIILWKYVFPSLMGNIRKREEMISKSVDDAEAISRKLEDIKKEEAAILKDARKRADGILSDTRKEAQSLRKRLLDKAQEEADAIISEARIKAAEERELAVRSLQDELADFVCDTSEKIVGMSFTSDKDRELVRELAEKL